MTKEFKQNKQVFSFQTVILVLLSAAFLFSSCKGFINADENSKEINNFISYANAPFYTISIDYDGGSGVVKSPVGGEVQKKVSNVFIII